MSSGNDDYSRDASHTNRDHEGEGPEHGDTRDTKSPARTVNKEWNDLLDHDWDSFFTWGPDVGSVSHDAVLVSPTLTRTIAQRYPVWPQYRRASKRASADQAVRNSH